MLDSGSLAQLSNFELGPLRIHPGLRLIDGPNGSVAVEPLVMQLLVELSARAGEVLTRREIFERCWGSAPVGDDSLNRIVASLRRALDDAGNGIAVIETVPRTGYSLRFSSAAPPAANDGAAQAVVARAVENGLASIRLGFPQPDLLGIEGLRFAVARAPGNAEGWAMLALLCRYAAEYADAPKNLGYLAECEASARRALNLDRCAFDAQVALATVAPLFGRWLEARSRLAEIIAAQPGCWAAAHELAIVEMATGRVAAAKAIVDTLLSTDPLAAALCYKSIYQHWSTGDLLGMDYVGERAIQLWPSHPAIWTARFWTLAYTDRAPAALRMLEDETARPRIPVQALQFLHLILSAVLSGRGAALARAADVSLEAARAGPVQAISALFALGLLGRPDAQMDISLSYYLREGGGPVPIRHMKNEPTINDQHRRVTQILFTPACALLRSDPRFLTLCDRIGLTAYWASSGLQPDFISAQGNCD